MSKMFNFFLGILILFFFINIYNFYSSNKNLETKEFNRNNIDQIINKKISNLPILKNDTDNVIEFNDGFSNEIQNDKPRSFWNLLKFK
ncbi:hypothetical protein IDH18_00955 [Pelagibacterales bacterium SAG-MED41]|nr:hypothetical protein [Pelagibacterales bacterium SAG-MED41]